MNRPSRHFFILFILVSAAFTLDSCRVRFHRPRNVRKPVIYLYPTDTTTVSVKLETEMLLTITEPAYNGEWKVVACPNGNLLNTADGKTYPYLFWEAKDNYDYSMNEGFCVPGDSSEIFLRNILPGIGLNETETAEFIAYWLADLRKNKFNVITFAGDEYTSRARLHISPEPNAMLRVFMVFRSADERVGLAPQIFRPFAREGFTVVEWGGTDVSTSPGEL